MASMVQKDVGSIALFTVRLCCCESGGHDLCDIIENFIRTLDEGRI
jgi:hypothetical protein